MSEQEKEKLAQLVSDLPEIYQPVFGHEELCAGVSRPCEDRLVSVVRVYDALQTHLNRPLRVLDLGCAQGFFSLELAARGAEVTGIDCLDENIAVCIALAEEHPDYNVRFETGRIEDWIGQAAELSYDLVLGLSVFHHLIHEKGAESTQGIIDSLAESSGLLLIEAALKEEPLYWADAQPEDPRTLFEHCAFVQETARHSTHLSAVTRPMYAVSNRFWVVENRCGEIESWTDDPHAFAKGTHQNSRRYFFSPNAVVKQYRFDHPRGWLNRKEFEHEISFFEKVPEGFPAPAFLGSAACKTEGWTVLERLPGRLLLELLLEHAEFERMSVLQSVLEQLAVLEAAGLYHNDVRAWNILIGPDGAATLLDAGSISSDQQDCVWPENIFLSFFIFVHELLTGEIAPADSLRLHRMTPYSLPQPCRDWAAALWRYPVDEWSFSFMLELLNSDEVAAGQLTQPLGLWIEAIEEAVNKQIEFVDHFKRFIASSDVPQDGLLELIERMEQVATNMQEKTCRVIADEEAVRIRAEKSARSAEERAVLAEARSQQNVRLALSEAARAGQAEKRIQTLETDLNDFRERLMKETQAFQQQVAQLEEQLALRDAELHQAEIKREERAGELQEAQDRIQWLENERDSDKAKIDELNHTSHHWWAVADTFRRQLDDVHNSRCVRWTAPLRWISMQLRRLRDEGLFARLKALVKKILRLVVHRPARSPLRSASEDETLADEESKPLDSEAENELSVDELLSRIRRELSDPKKKDI